MTETSNQSAKRPAENINVLTIGLPATINQMADLLIAQYHVTKLGELTNLTPLLKVVQPTPDLIICATPPPAVDLLELVQVLRMLYMDATIFYTCLTRDGYDRKNLIGNGVTDAFLLPMDVDTFQVAVIDALALASHGKAKSYRPVKLVDIQPETVLSFGTSLFMPVNEKYIPYSAAGDPIDAERAEQLQKHKVSSVFIDINDVDKFYKYTAESLRNLASSSKLSATEKSARMQGAIRELMTGIFNDSVKGTSFDSGRAVVKDCREIVKAYVSETPQGDWYKRLLQLSSVEGSTYSHAADVSAFAALFSMGLGIGVPEEMAMAGILHDIGLADVPMEIQITPEVERTPDEQSIYKRHPEMALELLNRKKLLLPPKVSKAILQHHEAFNGSGYPRGVSETRICPEAQILRLADTLDYMTAIGDGKPMLSPGDALNYFRAELERPPEQQVFDPVLLKKFLELFEVQA